MKLDLERIEDAPLALDERLVIPADRLDPSLVAGTVEVRAQVRISSLPEEHLLRGRMSMSGRLICVRCLEELDWSAEEEVTVRLVPAVASPSAEEIELEPGDLDVRFVVDHELDLLDVAAEQVLLALPMHAVCREDCAGVCPTCGANLNDEGACTCDPVVDPRWAALADLRGRNS